MKTFLVMCGFLVGGLGLASAQAPAGAPAGANGICKDGTYSMAAAKSGACAGHKGVQTWYTAASAAKPVTAAPAAAGAATPVVKPTPAATAATTPAVAKTPAPAPAPAAKGPAAEAATKTAVPGGAPNLVWVNTSSNVYHCYGTTYYGKTKAGAYMTEADAIAKKAHGERGQTCSK